MVGFLAARTKNVGQDSSKGLVSSLIKPAVALLLLAYAAFLQQANLRLEMENETLRKLADGARAREEAVEEKEKKVSTIIGGGDEVEWAVPEDLQKLRSEECMGGIRKKTTKTGGFCLGKANYMGLDESLANAIAESVVKGGSVVDLGAGLGWYGKALMAHKTHPVAKYAGYDGAIDVEEKTEGFIRHMDLTQPSPIDRRPCGGQADWVLSLEVAEHIPPQYTDSYLRNVRCRAKEGAIISWAKKGQSGTGHVNTKDMDDAVKQVERWGFKADMEATKIIQEAAKFKHFKQTPIVYRVLK